MRRLAERAVYDRSAIHSILDEALICHVGIAGDEGPVVIPTIHARIDDTLYLHGSPASRLLRTVKRGEPLCVTATIVDGIVLAKSHFHSSMNYRSVVVFGTGRLVDDRVEQDAGFRAITEHIDTGRWDRGRQPSEAERRATVLVAVSIDEASAKVRTGGPKDDPEDLELPFWSGVIPLTTERGQPISE
ncbi:MAG: pyridoxamine 5'-phosphate oxidase family protein [Acidimicrobiia bacterium]|nr:pyridoxamine 5'-phosphate oxidase family protein [Acidimicrobiia bacterium]